MKRDSLGGTRAWQWALGGSVAAVVRLGLGLMAGLLDFSQAADSKDEIVSLQSFNLRNTYIRHRNGLGFISQIHSDVDRRDARWCLCPGLAGANTVSIRSATYPKSYLRHHFGRVKLHHLESSGAFKKDASFRRVKGLADASCVSFEAVNFPGHFLRHKNGELWLEKNNRSKLFAGDATFRVVPALTAPRPIAKETPATPPAKLLPRVVAEVGHSGSITALAFSPNGKQVLTGSSDKTARLWDVDSGTVVRTFPHGDPVACVAFTPDGTQVITGGGSVPIRFWDSATGKQLRAVQGQWGETPALSADGKYVLSSGGAGVHLKELATGRHIHTFARGASGKFAAISADGTKVITGGFGSNVSARLWDAGTGREMLTLPKSGQVQAVAFSPDGKWVLTQGGLDGVAHLWDAASGKHRRAFGNQLENQGAVVAFSPDGTQVLTGAKGGVRLWDIASGKATATLLWHDPHSEGPRVVRHHSLSMVESVCFSPDGKQLLTGSADDMARLWNLTNLAQDPNGTQLIPEAGDAAVPRRLMRTFRGEALPVTSVCFSPNGKQWLIGLADNKVRLWDTARGKDFPAFQKQAGYVTCTAFAPDGKHVLTGSGSSKAQLWDTASGTETRAFEGEPEDHVNALAFSPNGKQVVTATRTVKDPLSDVVHLWDVATGTKVHTFAKHEGEVTAVVFSPNGRQVLSADGKMARLWDADSGKLIRPFKWVHNNQAKSAAFSRDGKRLLTWGGGAGAGSLSLGHLWDPTTPGGTPIGTFDKRVGFTSMAFSPDGQLLLAGCADGTSRLLTVASAQNIRGAVYGGKVVRQYRGKFAAFSPNGKRVLTGSNDAAVRLLDAATGKEICRLISFRDDSWIAVTSENYYMASSKVPRHVSFSLGVRAFPFEQFDLKYNRPDKVIERIGLAAPELVAAYRHAYQKRLQRTKFTEEMLSDDFHVPEITVTSSAQFTTRDKTLKLKVTASDSRYLLDRLNIGVNGVPLHGTDGFSLRQQASKTSDREIDVELSAGRNKIEVSVLNEKGAESLKERLSLQCDAPAGKPNLYVVAVGVSDYQDERFRLTYADKDARDLADFFEGKRDRFGKVSALRILNRDATRANIVKAKDFLKDARVDDLVVVFCAGHGLLDSKLDYYFATADLDFKHPEARGLPYEDIEGLLEGSRARKKLLLMDTCHSGELDKEEVQVGLAENKFEDVKVRTFRGLDLEVAPRVGLGNSYQLLREMFADLRRGTGAVVISSAGGAEYAMESATWKNGVFTHALLRGLKGEADRNRDKRIQVSELRDFVEHEVKRLTHGRQTPTMRRENLAVDFPVD